MHSQYPEFILTSWLLVSISYVWMISYFYEWAFPFIIFLFPVLGFFFFFPPRELPLAFVVTLVWWWRMVKNGKGSTWNAGDFCLIPGLGRSSGEENIPTPVFLPGEFQGNTVHGVTKSQTWLNTFHFSGLYMFVSGFILPEILYIPRTGWLFLFPC